MAKEAEDSPERIADNIGARDTTPRKKLSPETRRFETLTDLKEYYGLWILRLMAAQLVVVNAAFLVYAWQGYDLKPPSDVVKVWLISTFVQIVSVVAIISRSLFPRDKE